MPRHRRYRGIIGRIGTPLLCAAMAAAMPAAGVAQERSGNVSERSGNVSERSAGTAQAGESWWTLASRTLGEATGQAATYVGSYVPALESAAGTAAGYLPALPSLPSVSAYGGAWWSSVAQGVSQGAGEAMAWMKVQAPVPAAPAAVPRVHLAKSHDPSFPADTPAPADADSAGMPELVKQSIGCVVSGAAGSGIAVLAGGENLIGLISGGVVVPSNPVVLYTGLIGVVFASFCAVGQAVTPLYDYYFDTPPAPRHQEQGPGLPLEQPGRFVKRHRATTPS